MRGLKECPKCKGHGTLKFHRTFWRKLFRRPNDTMTCDVCHGAGVVPHYGDPS